MKIQVNGFWQEVKEGLSIQDYMDDWLKQRGFDKTLVSVELNFLVRPRQRWPEIRLSDGDIVEIVRFVGGG